MDPDGYSSGHNLKNTGLKQEFDYARKYAICLGNSYFKSCRHIYVTVDFKKVVSSEFHHGSTPVESECIKIIVRLSE